MKDIDKDDADEKVPLVCSQRWILAYIGFLGFGVINALRVNISVAVVCMLKTINSTDMVLGVNTTESVDARCSQLEEMASIYDRAELEWDQATKSSVLASFFYGYIVTQVPGGWLADRYGGKRVLGIPLLLSALLTLLVPICARTNVYLVYTVRVLMGLLMAVTFPAMHAMWGRWAPPFERSKLTTLCYTGQTFGNVATFLMSGFLCAHGFDNGWGSIFYVTGILAVIWAGFWFYITADSPSVHPRITDKEKQFILGSIEYNTEKKNRNVPWLAIVKSPCVWACLTAHVCDNWTNYTLLTNIPTFMREALKFDITANGALSTIPYICQLTAAMFSAYLADMLRVKHILSTTATRKIFQIFSFTGAAACLVATGFCTCLQRNAAVALLTLAVMFTGFGRSAGYVVNHVDFAPKYAGVLYGITNTLATIPGMLAPIVAGWLTPNHTQEEWRNVFYVCAGFDAFGILIFGLFASGELQEWAKDVPITKDILVTAKAPGPATGIKRTPIDDAHSVSASGLKDSMPSACTKVLSSTGQTGLLKTVNEKLFESTYM